MPALVAAAFAAAALALASIRDGLLVFAFGLEIEKTTGVDLMVCVLVDGGGDRARVFGGDVEGFEGGGFDGDVEGFDGDVEGFEGGGFFGDVEGFDLEFMECIDGIVGGGLSTGARKEDWGDLFGVAGGGLIGASSDCRVDVLRVASDGRVDVDGISACDDGIAV